MMGQFDSGRTADGMILFSPRTTRQLWGIVTPLGIGEPTPELAALRREFNGYALELRVRDYRSAKAVTHTGGLPEFFISHYLLFYHYLSQGLDLWVPSEASM
jgi:hypothetical protein